MGAMGDSKIHRDALLRGTVRHFCRARVLLLHGTTEGVFRPKLQDPRQPVPGRWRNVWSYVCMCAFLYAVILAAMNGYDWAEKSLSQYYLPEHVRSGSQLNGRLQLVCFIVLITQGTHLYRYVWLSACLSASVCVCARVHSMKPSDLRDNSIETCDRQN